jgi:hypothetical protein
MVGLRIIARAPSRGGRIHPASHAASLPRTGHRYEGPPGISPDQAHRQAALSLPLGYVISLSLSSCARAVWAHSSEADVVIHVHGLKDRCGPYGPPSETDAKILATAA